MKDNKLVSLIDFVLNENQNLTRTTKLKIEGEDLPDLAKY